MTYTKNTWLTGDTVTAQKLNNMEDGIEAAGALVVTISAIDYGYGKPAQGSTLDKTYEEIFNAITAGIPVIVRGNAMTSGLPEVRLFIVGACFFYVDTYQVILFGNSGSGNSTKHRFDAATADGTLTFHSSN